ncbi:death ligand signal enhancer isoform X3 [Choloepus didactylus]|uniref:death ligand signal enhancer isoform X3 n=1 Tax=Choloepus didactylus TaxID=27675 RepID=UPI00189C6D21|nr:death ligand signal enhancer isoform X3 [Choloepus didactylus]
MGFRLPPPPCSSLCLALTGLAPVVQAQALAQAQVQVGAQGPMDGRMPFSGCLPMSPQTPCGMPYHGAPWLCWLCSWQGRSTSRHPCQEHVGEQSTALVAVPWTVSCHFPCGTRAPSCWLFVALQSHVLPSPEDPATRHAGLREPRLSQEGPSAQPKSLSSHSSLRAAGLQDLSEEDPRDSSFLHDSTGFEFQAKPAQPQTTEEKQEQDKSKTLSLEEAVTSIQQLFQLSVSIAFNFLGNWVGPASGTENMKNGDYMAAFSYFQKAADRGYSKAQYNVGLCHEQGRGTPRNPSKAVLYYQLAASQGHSLAQYRYARCLLQDPASLWGPQRQRAVSLLKQAADSGLREAQAFLGVLFTKEPYLDEQKAVKYLRLAADNGDSQSRYHLGICYEKGLGMQRNLGEAVRCYQQSAALGNELAQKRLQTLFSMNAAALGTSDLAVTGLKSFSSPSLHSLNTLLAGASHLSHSLSTGNLGSLCRSGHLGPSPGAPSRAGPPHPFSLERSLVKLGFG